MNSNMTFLEWNGMPALGDRKEVHGEGGRGGGLGLGRERGSGEGSGGGGDKLLCAHVIRL